MKVTLRILTLLTVTALVLAACGSAATTTEESSELGSTQPSIEETMPAQTPETTESTTTPETTPMTTTESTPAMTPEATQPSTTTTAEPTQVITGTAVIPPTGFVDPGRASNLLDFQVWSQTNTQLGDVEDLVLDTDAMMVSYVVVKTAQDGKFIPVPWSALTVVGAQSQPTSTLQTPASKGPQSGLMLNVAQSAFDKAHVIDLSTIPELGQAASGWDADISAYWAGALGNTPSGTPAPTAAPSTSMGLQGVILASKLLENKLSVGQGLPTASVSDVIINVQTGAIQYVVVSVSGEAGGEKLIPIPLNIFSWDATNQTLSLLANIDKLVTAPSFANGEFPLTQLPDWDAQFRSFWSQLTTP